MEGAISFGRLAVLGPELSIVQKFRLLEIAHETKDHVIREWAVKLLEASCPNWDIASSCA